MNVFTRGAAVPHYHIAPAGDGWTVLEGERAIAYADSQAVAKAIAQALNLQRLMIQAELRMLVVTPPPAQPELN
jgi:hypothetical protein